MASDNNEKIVRAVWLGDCWVCLVNGQVLMDSATGSARRFRLPREALVIGADAACYGIGLPTQVKHGSV